MTKESVLFAELTPGDMEFISGHGIVRTFRKNAVVINEGDHSDSLYVILEGRVKVFVSDETDKEVILNIQGPGEYFGELALIDDTPRSASVMTIVKSRLVLVTRPAFERCLAKNPTLAVKLIRTLAKRIRSLTANVKDLALLDVYGRVARTLIKLAVVEDGTLVIKQRLTHQEIASMVGASREMVSRIMRDLVLGGYVLMEGKRMLILSKFPEHW